MNGGQDIFAVIDCGSHSTRLLVAGVEGGGEPQTLHRDMQITRMGEGVGKTQKLSGSAIQRTLDCISSYAKVLEELSSQFNRQGNFMEVRVVATAAARASNNSEELFDAVEKVLSTRPVLLDGKTEAELAFLGATQNLSSNFPPPYLTIDIGGGSTEFGFGTSACEDSLSLDIGSLNLTEKLIATDPPLPEELSACLSLFETYLGDLVVQIPEVKQAKTLIGMAGTVTTAAAVELGYYDPKAVHHFCLERAAAEDVFRTLSSENREQRLQNPGLHPERVDVIVAGLCILVKTMRFFGFDECLVSELDLMNGIIIDMSRQRYLQN